MKTVLAAALVAALAGSASAAIAFDPEFLGFGTNVNNTIATASPLGTFAPPGEGILVDGSITPGTAQTAGDVDWFSFTIAPPNNGVMVASIFTLTGSNTAAANDTFLMLADGQGNILAFNDDDNVGFNSSLAPVTLAAGTYYIGITGFGDTTGTTLPDGFVPGAAGAGQAGHAGNFTYKLIIGLNVVPTPGSAALLGLGALAAGRRRR